MLLILLKKRTQSKIDVYIYLIDGMENFHSSLALFSGENEKWKKKWIQQKKKEKKILLSIWRVLILLNVVETDPKNKKKMEIMRVLHDKLIRNKFPLLSWNFNNRKKESARMRIYLFISDWPLQ